MIMYYWLGCRFAVVTHCGGVYTFKALACGEFVVLIRGHMHGMHVSTDAVCTVGITHKEIIVSVALQTQ
jgi:hypothetical protein